MEFAHTRVCTDSDALSPARWRVTSPSPVQLLQHSVYTITYTPHAHTLLRYAPRRCSVSRTVSSCSTRQNTKLLYRRTVRGVYRNNLPLVCTSRARLARSHCCRLPVAFDLLSSYSSCAHRAAIDLKSRPRRHDDELMKERSSRGYSQRRLDAYLLVASSSSSSNNNNSSSRSSCHARCRLAYYS